MVKTVITITGDGPRDARSALLHRLLVLGVVAPGEVHPPREPVSRGQAGRHQFHRPMRHMAAGTSNARTMVASTTTAMPIPMPTAWTITERDSPNPRNTAAMMEAAPVMSR